MAATISPAEAIADSTTRYVPSRSMTLLGSFGDIELAWDEESDDLLRATIQKKMDEGVTFFLVKEPSIIPRIRRTKVKVLDDIKNNRVSVRDADVIKLLDCEGVQLSRSGSKIVASGIIRDAAIAAKSHTVATPRHRGG